MSLQVVFEVGGQFFGMNGSLVISVENGAASSKLYGAPDYCEGIMRFRGEIVPLVSIRRLLNITRGEEPKLSQVVIMRCKAGCIGFRVDHVVEIGEVSLKEMQVIPVIENRGATSYAMGIVRHNKMLVLITDHERLLPQGELKMIMGFVDDFRAAEKASEEEKLQKEAEKQKAELERQRAEAKRKEDAEAAAKKKAEAEAEAKKKAEAEAEAKKKAEAEAAAKKKAEAEAAAKKKAEAEAAAKKKAEAEAEAKKKAEAEAEAKKKAEAEAEAKKKAEEKTDDQISEPEKDKKETGKKPEKGRKKKK